MNKGRKQPLYQQLYDYVVADIRSGKLAAGQRLPGKRRAAAQLGISVNTVNEAYQMLAAEGYVEARPRSGFVVSRLELLVPPPLAGGGAAAPAAKGEGGPAPEAGSTGGPKKAEERGPLAEAAGDGAGQARTEQGKPPFGKAQGPAPAALPWRYSFASGDVDPALFPRKTWARLFREALALPGLYAQGHPAGDEELRQAVANYLQGYRGVRCGPEQLVMGAGLELLTALLAPLLPGPVALENPGYPKAAQVLRNAGAAPLPLPIDGQGLYPGELAASGARAAYLTPSHHFPTGAVMPVGRRTELLRWAAEGERLLIEDDYDSEFRFDGRPLPSLQGLDRAGHVVYAGTFTRSLAPGLRAAYLVLPPALLEKWRGLYGGYACTLSRPFQHTLANFLNGGHFARNLNRMRNAYKKKRSAALEALQAQLPPGSWRAENLHTGLFFVLRLPGQNALALAARARAAGIRLRAVDEYRAPAAAGTAPGGHTAATSPTADALVLGYGGLAEGEAGPAAQALAALL